MCSSASATESLVIPYGACTQTVQAPHRQLMGTYLPKPMPRTDDPAGLLHQVIRQGLERYGVYEKARPGARACIVVTDRTRTTPNALIVPILLDELNARGVRDQDISLMIGVGMHAPDSPEDIRANVGEAVTSRITFLNNAPDDAVNMVSLGRTALGTPVEVHRRFADADIKLGTGNVNPCMLAGWSAGAKIVLPGVASRRCIYENHKHFTRTLAELGVASLMGVMPPDNRVRADLEEAAQISGIDMVVETVLDFKRSLSSAFAGDVISAQRQGVEAMREYVEVRPPEKADILLAGVGEVGYECSLFQGGSRVCGGVDRYLKDGGTLIMVNECREGIYEGFEHEQYRQWMRQMPTPAELARLTEALEIGGEKSCVLYTFSWLLHQKRCRIIVVTGGMTPAELSEVHLDHAPDAQSALERALSDHGPNATLAVMPFGGLVLPVLPAAHS